MVIEYKNVKKKTFMIKKLKKRIQYPISQLISHSEHKGIWLPPLVQSPDIPPFILLCFTVTSWS